MRDHDTNFIEALRRCRKLGGTMNISQRKALDEKIQNGYKLTLQDSLDYFFLPEDQNGFAQSLGYEDKEQMIYYENMSDEVPPMTDREAEEFVEREEAIAQEDGKVEYLAPPPSEILVLARQDSREVYTDSEDCPRDGDFEHMNWQDLAGVY